MVRSLCADCGLNSAGSHSDLMLRLVNAMKSRPTYKKVFEKIWAPAGELLNFLKVLHTL